MSAIVESVNAMMKRYEDNAGKIKKSVDVLRKMAREETSQNPERYDIRDVKLLDGGDISMVSYLEAHDWKIQAAYESMKKHSLWRKEINLYDMQLEDIPREIYQIDAFHPFGRDKMGHPTLFIRMSRAGAPKEGHGIILKYFLWAAERMRSQVIGGDRKFAIIFDCRSPQASIGLVKEILSLYTSYYPLSVAYVAFVEMGLSFRVFYKLIKLFFPKYFREQMFLLSLQQLKEIITDEEMPAFFGGSGKGMPEKWINSCPSWREFALKQRLPDSSIKKMHKYFDELPITVNNN